MTQTVLLTQCRVETPHASRYLQQLCKHWAHKFEVSFDAEHGKITMPEAREVTLVASADALLIRLAAPADTSEHMQHVVDSHIARFAFREELSFDWQPA